MSNYLYLVCEAHNPPLLSEDEVTQHPSRVDEMTQVLTWLRERDELVDLYEKGELIRPRIIETDAHTMAYFRDHAARFLARHKACPIALEDEAGCRWDTETGQAIRGTIGRG